MLIVQVSIPGCLAVLGIRKCCSLGSLMIYSWQGMVGIAKWNDFSSFQAAGNHLCKGFSFRCRARETGNKTHRQLQGVLEMLYLGPAWETPRKSRDKGHWPLQEGVCPGAQVKYLIKHRAAGSVRRRRRRRRRDG